MKKLSIKESMLNRLQQFIQNGVSVDLNYQASINDFSDISLIKDDFNRILFNLCVLTSKTENKISINVNNCSQFFILSFDCKDVNLPSCQEGAPLPLGSIDPNLNFLNPYRDQLQIGLDHFGRNQLILRIPLKSNEDLGSPLLRVS